MAFEKHPSMMVMRRMPESLGSLSATTVAAKTAAVDSTAAKLLSGPEEKRSEILASAKAGATTKNLSLSWRKSKKTDPYMSWIPYRSKPYSSWPQQAKVDWAFYSANVLSNSNTVTLNGVYPGFQKGDTWDAIIGPFYYFLGYPATYRNLLGQQVSMPSPNDPNYSNIISSLSKTHMLPAKVSNGGNPKFSSWPVAAQKVWNNQVTILNASDSAKGAKVLRNEIQSALETAAFVTAPLVIGAIVSSLTAAPVTTAGISMAPGTDLSMIPGASGMVAPATTSGVSAGMSMAPGTDLSMLPGAANISTPVAQGGLVASATQASTYAGYAKTAEGLIKKASPLLSAAKKLLSGKTATPATVAAKAPSAGATSAPFNWTAFFKKLFKAP